MIRIAVTGAGGRIGSKIIKTILKTGRYGSCCSYRST